MPHAAATRKRALSLCPPPPCGRSSAAVFRRLKTAGRLQKMDLKMDLLSVTKLSSEKDEIYKPIFASRLLITNIVDFWIHWWVLSIEHKSNQNTEVWLKKNIHLNLLMDTSQRWNGRVDPKTTSERGPTKSPVSVLSGFKYILKSNTVRSLLPRGTAATFKPSKRGLSVIRELDTFTPESARTPSLWGGVVFDCNPTGLQQVWTCWNLLFKPLKEQNVLLTNEFLTSVSVDV